MAAKKKETDMPEGSGLPEASGNAGGKDTLPQSGTEQAQADKGTKGKKIRQAETKGLTLPGGHAQETISELPAPVGQAQETLPEVAAREDEDEIKRSGKAFPIVAIGASAGGLEPIEAFFSNLPTPLPLSVAFVLIQHLSPEHKSLVGEILKKDTDLPLREIHDGLKAEPNTIYFNPPDREVAIYQGVFHLMEPDKARHIRMPINFFFRSLAEDLEDKAVCIVLSGTGSDGTLGLESVKNAGGMTMAQTEEGTKYPFMPRSAIDTGLVDFVLPAEKMPEAVFRYLKHPYLEVLEKKDLPADKHYQVYLQKILMLVRTATKHDFSHYKQTTIRRRISRRMAIHKIEEIAGYLRFLQQNPSEVQGLFQDLVIRVTSFFRDAEAFKALAEKVLPKILARKSLDQWIRVWVPGCGTGEEALSLAMLVEEAMGRADKRCRVQIFATDIDAAAIEKARTGKYPESIAADVSAERLKLYFNKNDGFYTIKQDIREMVVYAVQNLISDPPFSHLDLISCRNLLIYLDTSLQRQILPMFHFTLNQDGFLFLGSSESIGDAADLFSTVDQKSKIFQRQGPMRTQLEDYPVMRISEARTGRGRRRPDDFFWAKLSPAASERGERGEESEPEPSVRDLVERLVLEDYAPPAILVNNLGNIIYLQGDLSKFLSLAKGEPSYNLMNLANEELRPNLITALHRAVGEKKKVKIEAMPFRKSDGDNGFLNLTVRPLEIPGMSNLCLMVFEELPGQKSRAKKGKNQSAAADEASTVAVLQKELQATKEYLQTTVEELEASNEELKSTNEELQSTNEELQSTNEELETAKEELQSTNEELVTVNSELNNKIDELNEVNSDIYNLLASTEIATLFLDRELCIKRYTPAAIKLFNLIPQDVGRPLRDIAAKFEDKNLWREAEEVLHTLQVKEMELKSATGEIYVTRIMPYRTRQNVIDGVLITSIDISVSHFIHMAKQFSESLLDTVREPLLILRGDLKILSANRAFYKFFQTSKEQTENQLIYQMGSGQWNIPRLRELLENIIPQSTSFNDFEVEYEFPSIGHRIMLLNARQISATGGRPDMILLALEDVTESREQAREDKGTISRLEQKLEETRKE